MNPEHILIQAQTTMLDIFIIIIIIIIIITIIINIIIIATIINNVDSTSSTALYVKPPDIGDGVESPLPETTLASGTS